MKVFPENHGRFKDLAAGMQSLVVALAVLAGGIWSLFTFGALEQSSRARRELERISRDLKYQANVKLSMTMTPLDLGSGTARYVDITVRVENLGNRATRIDLRDPPLRVLRVDYTSPELITYPETVSLHPMPFVKARQMSDSILVPAGSQTYTFLARLSMPGLYWASFNVPLTSDDLTATREIAPIAADHGGDTTWSTGMFFVVK